MHFRWFKGFLYHALLYKKGGVKFSTLNVYEYKCSFHSVIIITLHQLCPLADEFKQIWGKTIASKKLAWEKGKEEWKELGGMIFISPPVLGLQKRPCPGLRFRSNQSSAHNHQQPNFTFKRILQRNSYWLRSVFFLMMSGYFEIVSPNFSRHSMYFSNLSGALMHKFWKYTKYIKN